jgi:hypothetical protein
MNGPLEPGIEASVVVPPRVKGQRMRLHRIEPSGDLTFIRPRNGGAYTVHPDAVKTIYKAKAQR